MTQTVTHSPGRSEALHTLVEDFYEAWLRLNPIDATYIGDNRFNHLLGNPASDTYHAQTKALYQKSLEAARAIDTRTLSKDDWVTLEVFLWECEQALALRKFPIELLPLNQMDSLATTLVQLGSGEGAQPFENTSDHEAWLQRAIQFPSWVDATISQLKKGQKEGVTFPQEAMQNVVPQLDAIASVPWDRSIFRKPLEKIPTAQRADWEEKYRAVFKSGVLPAYARLRDFIQKEHLPACRNTFGFSALPDGAAWYQQNVERMTTTRMTPKEIHGLGLLEVARIRREMENVKKTVGFQGSLPEFFAHVQADEKYFFKTPQALVSGYEELKTRIDAALPRLFSDFPRASYEVRATEDFRAQSAPGAEYQSPSADGKRPGIFYVNTYNLKAQPKYGMETLSLHEAAPGHHFQIAIAQELTHLPRFRRFGGYVAFAEGWALYAESLGHELGLFQDAMQYYGRLNDEQLRAMRLVVDTGLHAFGWTKQKAIAFMLENSSLAPSDVEAEVERYMVWPGQALGYKVGQWKLAQLREKAQAAQGSHFSLKAWHSEVLRQGSLPLSVLESHLERVGGQSN